MNKTSQKSSKTVVLCKCGKTSIYLRVNEGRHYCGKCLSRQIERSFAKEISKGKMIEKGDKVAVGVSGGKDSMVLLWLMKKLAKKVPITIIALTIDEGVKGYRDKSLKVVDSFAEKLGVEHRVFSFKKELDTSLDELKQKKFCTYCGVFRRYLLNKKARELGANKLAIGHNLDDEAQSALMNVIRGDVDRIVRNSCDENFVQRIKPLRSILEKELVAYALVNEIPYFDGECPYSFDNTRRDVQTIINDLEFKHPGTKNQIVKFNSRIKPVLRHKDGSVKKCKKCGEPCSQEHCKACILLKSLKDSG